MVCSFAKQRGLHPLVHVDQKNNATGGGAAEDVNQGREPMECLRGSARIP